MGPFDEIIGVGIGVPPAVAGSDLINTAMIICSQERARAMLDDIISILVQSQVSLNKHGLFQSKIPRDAFNIRRLEPWTDRFATTGAGQAIYMGKCLLMQSRKVLFHAPAFFMLKLLEELPVFLFFSIGLLLPILKEVFHHAKLSKIRPFSAW
jgi:hypothetical protein